MKTKNIINKSLIFLTGLILTFITLFIFKPETLTFIKSDIVFDFAGKKIVKKYLKNKYYYNNVEFDIEKIKNTSSEYETIKEWNDSQHIKEYNRIKDSIFENVENVDEIIKILNNGIKTKTSLTNNNHIRFFKLTVKYILTQDDGLSYYVYGKYYLIQEFILIIDVKKKIIIDILETYDSFKNFEELKEGKLFKTEKDDN